VDAGDRPASVRGEVLAGTLPAEAFGSPGIRVVTYERHEPRVTATTRRRRELVNLTIGERSTGSLQSRVSATFRRNRPRRQGEHRGLNLVPNDTLLTSSGPRVSG
jgi:hypothetical protein